MSGVSEERSYTEMIAEQKEWNEATAKPMKTAITVWNGDSSTSIVTNGHMRIDTDGSPGKLIIYVYEKGVLVKEAAWFPGSWDHYFIVRSEA